eukprot:TRINITY_DN4210_c0_g1_i2.p1 TRINITY_DN4210_c0_g1~~TRINITY_DN4210_c0_g1_i2.p1  ORF type:complete len:531 (-),score=73.69 TRINITY_DN4210_c0_g1_i2:208-1716(-)
MASPQSLTASQEAPGISNSLGLFEDLLHEMDAGQSSGQESQLLRDIYMQTFPEMREKLVILISNYQDNEVVLSSLLDLFDRMESLNAEYKRRTRMFTSYLGDSSSGSESDEDSDIIHEIHLDSRGIRRGIAISPPPKRVPNTPTISPPVHKFKSPGKRSKGKGKDKAPAELSPIMLSGADENAISQQRHDIYNNNPAHSDSDDESDGDAPGFIEATEPGTCPICCMDDIAPDDLYIYSQCKHAYCMDCLDAYYNSRINDGKVLDIKCPFPGCTTLVDFHQIHDVVSDEGFQRYEGFTFLATLNADPHVRWCPKAGCGNAMAMDPTSRDCHCQKCGQDFCGECKEDTHTGTCEEFQQWRVENGLVDKRYSKWANKHTKKCPQCKTPIEKASGCNHMTCAHCHHEWCWLCGRKYTPNHYDLYNVLGCPGLQSGSRQGVGMLRRMGLRALIGTGLVVGGALVAALAVPAAVVAGPIYGGYLLHHHFKRKRRRRRQARGRIVHYLE